MFPPPLNLLLPRLREKCIGDPCKPFVTVFGRIATIVAFFAIASTSYAQTYRATALGIYATAINNTGQIVGYAVPAELYGWPALWQNGTFKNLGTLNGPFGEAFGINNSGQVVGESGASNGAQHATLWANGAIIDLGTLAGDSSAAGINSSGQIVGNISSIDNFNFMNAAVWNGGTISYLDSSTTVSSAASAINDSGTAVGFIQPATGAAQAVIFSGSTMTLLPALPGSNSSNFTKANAINNSGQIVGAEFVSATDAAATAVIWDGGAVSALGSGQALGINNLGQIVGFSGTGTARAALWTKTGATALDLNQLIDPGTPLVGSDVLIEANGINDNGWIIAVGSPDGGLTRVSYLLQPETTLNASAAAGKGGGAFDELSILCLATLIGLRSLRRSGW